MGIHLCVNASTLHMCFYTAHGYIFLHSACICTSVWRMRTFILLHSACMCGFLLHMHIFCTGIACMRLYCACVYSALWVRTCFCIEPHSYVNKAENEVRQTEQMRHSCAMKSRFFIHQNVESGSTVLKQMVNAFSLKYSLEMDSSHSAMACLANDQTQFASPL